MQSSIQISKIITETLQDFWGYNSFRDSQEDIINAIISGKDTIALLPTGGGKSLCYQLPALVLEGTKNLAKTTDIKILVEMHSNVDLKMEDNASKILKWCKEVGYEA